jgi:hypothetical protein
MSDTIPIKVDRLAFETGDVSESYSADRIAEGQPIREPFVWGGNLWVCVSISGKGLTISGKHEMKCYRLLPPEMFRGEPTTYGARSNREEDAEAAKNDPQGFYNGVAVSFKGKRYIMAGPASIFVAEQVPERPADAAPEPQQLTLFA